MTPEATQSGDRSAIPEAFLSRVRNELTGKSQRPITFVLGSGVSNVVIPDVSWTTSMAVELLREKAPGAMREIDEERSTQDAPGMYRLALRLIDSYLGPRDVKGFVQTLALAAYTARTEDAHQVMKRRERFEPLPGDDCQMLERDVKGWKLPRAIEALGVLATQHPSRFRTVITTNFDPLVEIAVMRSHGHAVSEAFDKDGSLHQVVSRGGFEGLRVAHLHGYWNGEGQTLHTTRRLNELRPQLAGSLRELMSNSLVIVLGYGGWNDVFTSALRSVIQERVLDIDVIWCLYEHRPESFPEGSLLHELDQAGTGVNIYDNVDAHVVLPMIAAQHNLDAVRRIVGAPPRPPSSEQSLARQRLRESCDAGDLRIIGPEGRADFPDVVVWPHRLRKPVAVHAAQAGVARALLRGGARIVVLLNDFGGSHDHATLTDFEECIRRWTTIRLQLDDPDALVFQCMSDRDVLFPRSLSYDQILAVLEGATSTRTTIQQAVANAERESTDAADLRWPELLSPIAYWTYLLTLPRRELELKRVWTLSGDHHESMWHEFDDAIARGAAQDCESQPIQAVGHLLVPSPRDHADRPLVNTPSIDRDAHDEFARALTNGTPIDSDADTSALAAWIWRCLLELSAFLDGKALAPLDTAAGDVDNVDTLVTALNGQYRLEVASQLATRVWEGLYD
jgi:hypothetical protein